MANGPFRDLSPEEIYRISAKNRASRTHRLGDVVQDSREPETRQEAPGRLGPLPTATEAQATQPAPIESKNPGIPKAKATRRKRPGLREGQVLAACRDILDAHPRVALWWRQNTGGVEYPGGRYVKFSFTGAPDLMGVLKDGCFLAVECKASGRRATAAQQSFLDNVRDAGGLAICTDNPDNLLLLLNGAYV